MTRGLVKGRLRLVEILHVDTSGSRALFQAYRVNAPEKTACSKLMEDAFKKICRQYKGVVRSWDGDGGFAFFPSDSKPGFSILAAEAFLHNLPTLNAQTASIIDSERFDRCIRLAGHRGEIFITNNSGIDSAEPDQFDDFLKAAKKFCPKEDELFITNNLYTALPRSLKKRFGIYTKTVTIGTIKTPLYLLSPEPVPHADNIFERGDELQSITQDDWNYLRDSLAAQRINITARNSITLGLERLIRTGSSNGRKINRHLGSRDIFELTLRGLYNYLRAIDDRHKFSVCYWLPIEKKGVKYLQTYSFRYPLLGSKHVKREIPLSDNRYKACQAFNNLEIIATPSIKLAFNDGEWTYFDYTQKSRKRDLASSIQFPVFARVDDKNLKPQGVLSIDCSKPNFFLREEVMLLKEEFLHYLVNLSLATTLYECETH